MKNLLWTINVGQGVIDCSLNPDEETVIAGDVSGKAIIADYSGKIVETYKFPMPIWGVDIKDDIRTIALASKKPSAGSLTIIKEKKVIFEKDVDTPVWDVLIAGNKVVASTWGNGILVYDIGKSKFENISHKNSLFGINFNHNNVFINSSGDGTGLFDWSSARFD